MNNYNAALITSLGIRPIRDPADLRFAHSIRESADRTGEPVMIFGLTNLKQPRAESRQVPWLSDNGIAAPDGVSLFDLKNVEIRES